MALIPIAIAHLLWLKFNRKNFSEQHENKKIMNILLNLDGSVIYLKGLFSFWFKQVVLERNFFCFLSCFHRKMFLNGRVKFAFVLISLPSKINHFNSGISSKLGPVLFMVHDIYLVIILYCSKNYKFMANFVTLLCF